jgi:hypothetical protein
LVTQFEALNFTGSSLRQIVDEHNLTGIFVGSQAVLHECLQLIRKCFRRTAVLFQHDEHAGFHEAAVIDADHRRFEYGFGCDA